MKGIAHKANRLAGIAIIANSRPRGGHPCIEVENTSEALAQISVTRSAYHANLFVLLMLPLPLLIPSAGKKPASNLRAGFVVSTGNYAASPNKSSSFQIWSVRFARMAGVQRIAE